LAPRYGIDYVVAKMGTKLYDKAHPYFEVTSDEVDTEYYVSGQVVPAAARMLWVFGISQDELLFRTQRSLP
jgi:DNA polymerase, archaea type